MRVEGVRWGADRDAAGQHVLQGPGVGSVRVGADGEVVDQADRHAGLPGGPLGVGELLVDLPGEPAVELDALRVLLLRLFRVWAVRVTQALRPVVPVGAVHLRQGVPERVSAQPLALAALERLVRGLPAGPARHLVQQLQGLALERPDGVAVDQAVVAEDLLAQAGGPAGQLLGLVAPLAVQVRVLGDGLDPQVHRVGEAAGGGAVGGRVGGGARQSLVQGVDLHEARAQAVAGPLGQLGEVAEVAHAPGAVGQHGVQLGEEPPTAAGELGQPLRSDDQRGGRLPAVGLRPEGVPPERQVGGQPVRVPVRQLPTPAALQLHVQPRVRRDVQRGAPPLPHHHAGRQQPALHGRPVTLQRLPRLLRRAGRHPQRGQHRHQRPRPHRLPARPRVPGVHPVRLRQRQQFGGRRRSILRRHLLGSVTVVVSGHSRLLRCLGYARSGLPSPTRVTARRRCATRRRAADQSGRHSGTFAACLALLTLLSMRSCSATPTSAPPPPSTPTSASASSATPSTSSAAPSAIPQRPPARPTTATTHRFVQRRSADVAVSYCRQDAKWPHRKRFGGATSVCR